MKVKDSVCGMVIEDKEAAAKTTYKDKTYYFCSNTCKDKFEKNPDFYLQERTSPETKTEIIAAQSPLAGAEMAKDPICGMVIRKDTAIKRVVGERTYYFCSESCVNTFEVPEKELKLMKNRVTIALSGVLALAMLRVVFFLSLAAGATILTWVPVPALPWFTWGVCCLSLQPQ